ncbi:hypothetical protein MCAMS1_02136 [biofilm metagenome]
MTKGLALISAIIAVTRIYPAYAEENQALTTPGTLEKHAPLIEDIGQITPQSDNTSNEQLLRAQIKARESTQISSEMAGRIDHLKLRDGERFKTGQLLVGFHCSMEEAELSKAKATFEKKQKTHEVNQKLEKLNSISKLELSVAKAEEDEARADIRVSQAAVDRCTIKAPFSGKVVEVNARAHQSVSAGEPLLEIINDKDLEVEFISPSKALPQLKSGKPFKVILDETGKSYGAEIIRLGGRVDPVSQTIKVYGRIIDNPAELLPGMSGAIELPN